MGFVGQRFQHWITQSDIQPQTLNEVKKLIYSNRQFEEIQHLEYGDYGLVEVELAILNAIKLNKRIALYADYDVDGTMSCVSWIWFFRAIGFNNYTHYIPCRFKEGYGVNLQAIRHLIDSESAELIITMDTGITANEEAALCKERGVQFICTDHHKIQKEKMPDCLVLNPKQHPDPDFQELCGCGITFVLLRRLAKHFNVAHSLWNDLLALAGMATICDVVPLNKVNHKLAKLGVAALYRSERPVLQKLLKSVNAQQELDERDVGFRLGPRINAVGRLEHADKIIGAFLNEEPDQLIHFMNVCNDRRKVIQQDIYIDARKQAEQLASSPILFIGGDWHPGVVGIVASRLAEEFWRPVWLFNRSESICKGSARSISGFDVTEAMSQCAELFIKFGGHSAAGGFSFSVEQEAELRSRLTSYCERIKSSQPALWESKITLDCQLPPTLLNLDLTYQLDLLKPFGMGFAEPRFQLSLKIAKIDFLKDKNSGRPKHTIIHVECHNRRERIIFFNQVIEELQGHAQACFIVTLGRNQFRGETQLQLLGVDYSLMH